MSDLIDTTEMYLRTIFELEEEGIAPMRARIAERLGQSGPTVSQTVARMERDGLVSLDKERHLELTVSGRSAATRVCASTVWPSACWWKCSKCHGKKYTRKRAGGSMS